VHQLTNEIAEEKECPGVLQSSKRRRVALANSTGEGAGETNCRAIEPPGEQIEMESAHQADPVRADRAARINPATINWKSFVMGIDLILPKDIVELSRNV